jgi:hypothetical protein
MTRSPGAEPGCAAANRRNHHDIDLKDSKFERPELAGIDALITGTCRVYKEDES